MRPIQKVPFSHMKEFIKTVFKELKNRIYVYAGIVAVIVLIALTSKFDGWQGLTAIGTLGVAFSVLYLEVLLPYIKRPRLTLTFSQEDKKCCRKARIGNWQLKEVDVRPDHESMTLESPLEGPHEIIPPGGVLTSTVGLTHTTLLSQVNADIDVKGRKEIFIDYKKKGYFVRIKVQNTGGSLAKKCQGVVAEVELTEGDFDETQYFVPLVLHWANRSPRLCGVPIDLNTGAHWYLDVVYTEEDSDSVHVFHISTGERIGTIDKFKKGEYRLKIIIYAENSKPTDEKWLKLKWGGTDYKDVKAWLE